MGQSRNKESQKHGITIRVGIPSLENLQQTELLLMIEWCHLGSEVKRLKLLRIPQNWAKCFEGFVGFIVHLILLKSEM
jgi:hypothetical protein